MTRRRKAVIILAILAFAMVVAAIAVVNSDGFQRRVWIELTETIETSSGVNIEAADVSFRVLPARLVLRDVAVSIDDQTVLTVEEIRADWRWSRLAAQPRRIESIAVTGPELFADAFPEAENVSDDETPVNLWDTIEIGSFEIAGGRASADMVDLRVVVDDLSMAASLVDGSASALIEARSLRVTRSGRQLVFGPLSLRAEASSGGAVIRDLEIDGEAATLAATGELTTSPESAGRFETRVEGDVAVLAGWWDPNLVSGLDPAGRIRLSGSLVLLPDGGVEVELEHRGDPLRVAGYDLDVVEVSYTAAGPTLRVAGAGWGRAEVAIDQFGLTSVSADLEDAPIDRVLWFAAPQLADAVPGPIGLSGRIDTTFPFPIELEAVTGEIDVIAESADARLAIRGGGANGEWHVARAEAQVAGISVTGSGRVTAVGELHGEAEVMVDDPADLVSFVRPWVPEGRIPDVGGGALRAAVRVDGTLDDPALVFESKWSEPEIAGRRLRAMMLNGSGHLDDLRWEAEIEVDEDTVFGSTGTAAPLSGVLEAAWRVEVPDLGVVADRLALDGTPEASGSVQGTGRFVWSEAGFRLDGRFEGRDLRTESISIPHLETNVTVVPERVVVDSIRAEIFGGFVEGNVEAPLTGIDADIDGRLSWREIDIARLPIDVADELAGALAGTIVLGGTLERPVGSIDLGWASRDAGAIVDRMQAHVELEEGRVRAVVGETATRAGALEARAEVPLGDLERPSWLWPGAPGGPVTAHLAVTGLLFSPIAELLDLDTQGTEIDADVEVDVEWNPLEPQMPRMTASAKDLRVIHPNGKLVADGPLNVRLHGRKLEIDPVSFVGLDSRIDIEAIYDAAMESVELHVTASVSEELARLVPSPVRTRGRLSLDADLRFPVSADLTLDSIEGTFRVDHGDGVMVMRDPPVEIRGLEVSAALHDGRVDILDGRAEVNRGTVLMGGGWDPVSGQGLVFELQGVTLFFEGILSRWDGEIALEPRPDGIARATGDLTLVAGLWDEAFDLTSAIFGPADVELAADDPLYEISLDLNVRGRSGIRVDNNLGHFDVNWDLLRIDGSAAAPRLRGSVRIAPGGILALGGQEIAVRRGSLEFTGDPAIDPVVEIVPESDMTLLGGDDGSPSLDPTLIATRGLAQSLTSALGFENETLRPAEIAVQTERDPSVNFMVGQRLSSNLALFLTTNLTDVQDRTAMLQAWNFRGLRGLVFQAYQATVDNNAGGNIYQRFTWGGTASELGRPEINRLRLEGDWPMSKRSLKKSTRLRSGQPFEPFLLFVAAVRMERALAENGYQDARVTGFQEGDERLPTLVFFCDPGEPQFVRFTGEPPPRYVRGEVTSLYEPPPLESASFAAMKDLLTRSHALDGYPDAQVSVQREGDIVVVDVQRGERVDVKGPFFDGLPPEIAVSLGSQLGSATVLATMAERPDRLERTIEQRLAWLGYLDAEVVSIEVRRSDVTTREVRITVEAGQRQRIDDVVFVGDDPLHLANPENVPVRAGQPLNRDAIERAVRELADEYIEAGYRDARSRYTVQHDETGRSVVEVEIEPGALRRLRRVEYSGVRHANTRVLDKGLLIETGEVVTDAAVDRSANRIANFSPIERVEVRTRDVGASQVDVEFDVVEKPRWTAELGGGWSTERGFGASFGVRDEDLFGRGIGLNLRGGWDATERRLFVIGSVPPAPGGRVSLISTLGFTGGDAPDQPDVLEQEQYLASLEAQYGLANRVQVGLYYRWTDTHTFEKEPDPFFPFDTRVKLGTIGVRTIIDRFDNLFDPRSGYGLTSDLGWSTSALGSDFNYISWLSNFSIASTPFGGATWLQTARVGVAEPLQGENLIVDARFFAGGQASVRGFDLDSVGPVTFGLDGTLVPAGGGALFILNEELRIPVWGDLRLAVFTDIGQVWPSWGDADLELSVGAGVGLRWSTPIGPLWADVAWPVANVGISSKSTKFYLGIGRPF